MTSTHSDGGTANAPHQSRLRPRGWVLAVLVTSVVVVLGVVTAQVAQGRGYEETTVTEGLFYGDFDEDLVLFVGETPVGICSGADEPTHDARVFRRNDGRVSIKVDGSKQSIHLYESELGAPEFIDATCAALSDDDDSTQPVEPFAEGEGTVRMRNEERPDGTVHVVNSTVGSATDADGVTYRVRAWADLMIVEGVPQGDPADFQGLRVTRTGS